MRIGGGTRGPLRVATFTAHPRTRVKTGKEGYRTARPRIRRCCIQGQNKDLLECMYVNTDESLVKKMQQQRLIITVIDRTVKSGH